MTAVVHDSASIRVGVLTPPTEADRASLWYEVLVTNNVNYLFSYVEWFSWNLRWNLRYEEFEVYTCESII